MSKLLFFIIMLVILLSVLEIMHIRANFFKRPFKEGAKDYFCLLYTSDAADEL